MSEYTVKTTKGGTQMLIWDGAPIPGEMVAVTVEPAGIAAAALEPIFRCEECGGRFSAKELWGQSELPGSCQKCADAWYSCSKCGGSHHPDDPCPAGDSAPTCSYCDQTAVAVGSGTDGDFYCDDHLSRAPGATEPTEADPEWPNMCPHAKTCSGFSMGLDCPTAASPEGPSDYSCFKPKTEPTAEEDTHPCYDCSGTGLVSCEACGGAGEVPNAEDEDAPEADYEGCDECGTHVENGSGIYDPSEKSDDRLCRNCATKRGWLGKAVRVAYVAVVEKDGIGIGVASADSLGYSPYLHGYPTYAEADRVAKEMNEEAGIDPKTAHAVVICSMNRPGEFDEVYGLL